MRRLCGLLFVVAAGLTAQACGSSPIAAPTPIITTNPAPPVTPPRTLIPVRLAATVHDEQDLPVAGAEVMLPNVPQTITVSTDAAGAFEGNMMLYECCPSPLLGQVVQIRKAGFEPGPTDHWTPPGAILRLYRVTTIVAGQIARLPILSGGMLCGFEDEFLCRRVRVRAPAAGTLDVEVVPETGARQLDLVVGALTYPYRHTSRLSIPVAAGSETAVDVLMYWQEHDTNFVLSTTLTP